MVSDKYSHDGDQAGHLCGGFASWPGVACGACLSDGDEYSFYPINLLYIAAYMMERGHTVKVMDLTSQGLTLKDIINTI